MTRIEWLKNYHFRENELAYLWLSAGEKVLLEYESPLFVYEYFHTYPNLKEEFEQALEKERVNNNSNNQKEEQ
ncbi:MAG: hypothetical protein HON90_07670 [Halobacteriovoraceae bacterium]|jgi:hypothetical protein|nr:hypothetical protein [Halobacteriovoraceae bacterium]